MRVIAFVFSLLLCFTPAMAADYPEKPIHIYVPFAKGGAADVLMRDIASRMSNILKQDVIVSANEDKSVTASDYVKQKASLPMDGYSLIVGNLGTHGSAPAMQNLLLGYDPLADFKPVGMLGEPPMYLIVREDLPVRNFSELINYLRDKGTGATMAHAGEGSTSYLAGIFFKSLTKINPTMIPYSGSKPAVEDISRGYVDMMIDQSTSALPSIQNDLVRAMLYTRNDNKNESELTSDIPTSAQVGLPEFNITGWNMLFAPRNTPDPIVDVLNKALRKALKDRIIVGNMRSTNTLIRADADNNPDDLKKFVSDEINFWKANIPQSAKER